MGFAARDPNLYRYAWNSPTNSSDPSGLAAPHRRGVYDSPPRESITMDEYLRHYSHDSKFGTAAKGAVNGLLTLKKEKGVKFHYHYLWGDETADGNEASIFARDVVRREGARGKDERNVYFYLGHGPFADMSDYFVGIAAMSSLLGAVPSSVLSSGFAPLHNAPDRTILKHMSSAFAALNKENSAETKIGLFCCGGGPYNGTVPTDYRFRIPLYDRYPNTAIDASQWFVGLRQAFEPKFGRLKTLFGETPSRVTINVHLYFGTMMGNEEWAKNLAKQGRTADGKESKQSEAELSKRNTELLNRQRYMNGKYLFPNW